MFNVIISSYAREALCNRAIAAAIQHVPDLRFISICDQSGYSNLITDERIRIVRTPPVGTGGIAKRIAAFAILDSLPDDDVLVFLDDDIEMAETFRQHHADLLSLLAQERMGIIQLSFFATQKSKTIKLGYTGGGNVCLVSTYRTIGGHGDDYLDDVEFFLRAHIAGYTNYQFAKIHNHHRFRSPGGLRAALGVKSKATLHLQLSQLDTRYPAYIQRNEKRFMGFSLRPERKRRNG